MLSKGTSFKDDILELDIINVLSPPISQFPKAGGASFLGLPAKPWCLGLLFSKFQSRLRLAEFGAGLSVFEMRICSLTTTWNSETPQTTIPRTLKPTVPCLLLETILLPRVERPSTSTPASVRDDLPPNVVTAF